MVRVLQVAFHIVSEAASSNAFRPKQIVKAIVDLLKMRAFNDA